MFKLIGAKKAPYDGDGKNEIIKEFLCDTDADFANLPECDPGSMAVSIESGKVMVANTEGKWVEFGVPSGGGSDIVGTWVLNDTLTEGLEPNVHYVINGEHTYNGISREFASIIHDKPGYYNLLQVSLKSAGLTTIYNYQSGEWFEGSEKTITITGGDDINNEAFITWLKANATKVG